MMKNKVKVIFHIDLNAFYASCQLIEDPYLKGKPFIVGGSAVTRRGVVLTASYEARQFGIHSGMTVRDAMDKCATLRVVPTQFKLYREHSKKFFNYIQTFTTKMMKASIDEAYLDMTHHKDPVQVAKAMQQTLHGTYKLPCSIGIAPTLYLAKMASDMKKPLGITIVRKRDVVEKIYPLPLKDLYGLGRKTYPRLYDEGIMSIGDFCKQKNKAIILKYMSLDHYDQFMHHIHGHSSDVITVTHDKPKSISQETTMNYDIDSPEAIKELMHPLIDEMTSRLNTYQLKTKTVGYKFKTSSFQTRTKSMTMVEPTADPEQIRTSIIHLFDDFYDGTPIRLIGVHLNTYMEDTPFNLFTYHLYTSQENDA